MTNGKNVVLFLFVRSCSHVPFVVSGSQDHTIKIWDTLEFNQVMGIALWGYQCTGKSNTMH